MGICLCLPLGCWVSSVLSIAISLAFVNSIWKRRRSYCPLGGKPSSETDLMHLEMNNDALEGKTHQVKTLYGIVILFVPFSAADTWASKPVILFFISVTSCLWFCAEDDAELSRVAFIGPEDQSRLGKFRMYLMVSRISWLRCQNERWQLGTVSISRYVWSKCDPCESFGYGYLCFTKPDSSGRRSWCGRCRDAVERVAGLMGNSLKRLDHPNIVTIFVGIFLGILFGSLPIAFPAFLPGEIRVLPVVRWLYLFWSDVSVIRWSWSLTPRWVPTWCCVKSVSPVPCQCGHQGWGANFVSTVVDGDGLLYVGCGFLITVMPLLIMGACSPFPL